MNRKLLYTGSSILGTGVGSGLGYYRAKRLAKQNNLDENSKEYKNLVRKNTLIGGAIGGITAPTAVYGISKARNKYRDFINKGSLNNKNLDKNLNLNYNKGDLVYVDKGAYKHYGVVVDNNGSVIEFNSDLLDPRTACIRKTTLNDMAKNGKLYFENPSGKYTPDEIVERATSRLGTGKGTYNLRTNNCEVFARDVVNGTPISKQVTNVLEPLKVVGGALKTFSANKVAPILLKEQGNHLLSNHGFQMRKFLSKDLGGLSHFDRNQTTYLAGGGSIIGGAIGRYKANREAKKEAKNYNLKKGTLEYDNFIKQRKLSGTLKGAAIGGISGAGLSRGSDFLLGKVKADRLRATKNMDLGKNYFSIGKSLRGINSDARAAEITNNLKEVGNYGAAMAKSIL